MKDIKGYEGLYAVTSCGRVWSYSSNKFLKFINKDGYFRVNLYKNNKRKQYFVHRLVAETYIPNKENLPEVNHKDEDKTHNYINNLEWCTREYNLNYGTHNERVSKSLKKNVRTVRCIENNKIYTNYDQIRKELHIDRENIRKNMSRSVKNGCSLGGYHFEEVM